MPLKRKLFLSIVSWQYFCGHYTVSIYWLETQLKAVKEQGIFFGFATSDDSVTKLVNSCSFVMVTKITHLLFNSWSTIMQFHWSRPTNIFCTAWRNALQILSEADLRCVVPIIYKEYYFCMHLWLQQSLKKNLSLNFESRNVNISF